MFWQRLYELCKENNTSPTQMVNKLGIAQGMVTKWKNGTEPNAKALLKISEYFNVSTDYLLGKTDKKNKTAPEGQPLTDEEKAILKKCEQLSVEDLHKVLEYVELLKLKRNSENESKETIRLVARSGDQKEITKSKKEFEEISAQLKEDTTSDY